MVCVFLLCLGLAEDEINASVNNDKGEESDETASIGLSCSQIQYEEPKLGMPVNLNSLVIDFII